MNTTRRDAMTLMLSATFLPTITATLAHAADAADPLLAIQTMSDNEPTDRVWRPLSESISRALRKRFQLACGIRSQIYELSEQPGTALIMADFVAVTHAVETLKAIPIATINRTYTGPSVSAAIITLPSSPIRTASDLRGKRFGLVDPSIRTRFLPEDWLAQHGIAIEKELTLVNYDTWSDVFVAVVNNRVDAGAIGTGFLENLAKQRPDDVRRVRVIEKSIDPRTKFARTTASVPDLTVCALPSYAEKIPVLTKHLLGITAAAPAASAADIKGFVSPPAFDEYAKIAHRLNLI